MYGLLVLLLYTALMLGATFLLSRRAQSADSFHVADRRLGLVQSAMSIAATWIWAPALFTSAEKAYTTGWPFWLLTVVLALIAFSYSQYSGIRASVLTDALQMLLMLGCCALLVPWALSGNGFHSLVTGLSGFTGEFTRLFDKNGLTVLLSFGLPTAIGLFAAPFGDQCFWQRAFSVRKDKLGKAFQLGAVLFAVVPLSMGLLGFIAAGSGFTAADAGMVGFELVRSLFPAWVMVPFLFMLISGLLSTVDSNLCAAASLTSDFGGGMKAAKGSMLAVLAAAVLIANLPGLTVTGLFLIYGALRSTTMLPTILTLKGKRLTPKGVTAGVLCSMLIGMPIFILGTVTGSAALKTAGSLCAVLLSGVASLGLSHRGEVRA